MLLGLYFGCVLIVFLVGCLFLIFVWCLIDWLKVRCRCFVRLGWVLWVVFVFYFVIWDLIG